MLITNKITDFENVDEDSQNEESDDAANDHEDDNVQETFDIIEVTENVDFIETVAIVETVKCDIVDAIEAVCFVNVAEETVQDKLPPFKRRKCLMCDYEAKIGAEIRDHKQSTHIWATPPSQVGWSSILTNNICMGEGEFAE